MTQTGRCLCGDITYELAGDPIIVAACHCEHCQRQSGAAFSVNVIAQHDQLTINGPIKTYEDRGRLGDAVHVRRKFCGNCGSPIVSLVNEPPGMIALKAGTLNDHSWVEPKVQAWCVDKQPWVDMPAIAAMDRE